MVQWLALAVAVAAVVAAVVYPRRQTRIAAQSKGIAAESKQIAADARNEAKRAADAAEGSEREAKRVADIEARRDHRKVPDELQLVEVTSAPNTHGAFDDLLVVVRNVGQRPFQYRARIFHAPNSSSELRQGTWDAGEEKRFRPGPVTQEFSHIEIWLDGECPCAIADGSEGHWRVVFPMPPPIKGALMA